MCKPKVNITITWKDAISVEKFKEDEQLSTNQKKIVQTEDVIYIFVGANKHGDKAADAGQTSRSLDVRTKEHIKDKDYLEKFPKDQLVYCGEVKCARTIDRDLLEQIEGAVIHALKDARGFDLCNKEKLIDYKKPYKIEYISNEHLTGDLLTLLKATIYPEN